MKRRVVSIRSSDLYIFHQHIWALETAIDISSVLGGLFFLDLLMHKMVKRATRLLSLFFNQKFDSVADVSFSRDLFDKLIYKSGCELAVITVCTEN